MHAPNWKWLLSTLTPQAHMYGIEQYVYGGRTKYQYVEIFDTEFYGRCLVLDGKYNLPSMMNIFIMKY